MAITANQVTLLRIFLLPLPVALLMYGNEMLWWLAFFIFVLLGATDFIDGMLARRDGPTKLGALIDPVADKIFIVAGFMSMCALGMVPGIVLALLFWREFLLIALRSSVASRNESVRTSKLAKIKTVFQMGGAGTIFFTLTLKSNLVSYICFLLAIFFLSISLYYYFKKRPIPYWSTPVFLTFMYVSIFAKFFGTEICLIAQLILIVSITWISLIDYLIQTLRIFKKTGVQTNDFIRLIWASTYGIFIAPVVGFFPSTVLPLLVCLSSEFSLGGLDNMLVAEKKVVISYPFIFSTIIAIISSIFINLYGFNVIHISPVIPAIMVMTGSLIIFAITFIKHLDLFRKVLS